MRLISRHTSIVDSRNGGGLCSDFDYQRLPRNPVFYPPTPKVNDTSIFADKSLETVDRRRTSRLVSRIKTIFSAKGQPVSNPKQRIHHIKDTNDTRFSHNARQMDNDRHTPPRHKLVARSPVREGCISPDFFAFADIDCLRTASSYDKQNAPNTAERKLKRRNFTTSVCLPSLAPVNYNASAGQNCSLSPSTTTTVFTRGNLSPFPEKADSQSTKHGVARSVSLISSRKTIPPILVPSLSTLPQIQCQASPDMLEKTPRRHRDSRGSETTAVPDIGLTGDHLCDMEPPSLSPSKQFKANSPSQKTLSGTCMSSEEFINNAFAESMLAEHPLLGITFDHEMDVFQAVSKSRRPHSEGFPEHSQSVEADKQPALSGNGYSGCIAIPLSNQWAAMYARSSYAESGLVKSTFDLAKLLPSAPQ